MLFACCLTLNAGKATGTTIQLDFGPTTVAPGQETNSAAHTAGALGGLDLFWNKVQTADIASGIRTSTDSPTTITINLGRESSSTSNVINFATQPSSTNALGTVHNTGIYTAGSVNVDGIFSGSSGQDAAQGVLVENLLPGLYDIYFVGRNTNKSGSDPHTIFASAVTSGATTFDYGSLTGVSYTNSTNSWAEGTTYAKLSVLLAAGQSLALASEGTDDRGFINAIQIVGVPEPSSLWLLLGGLIPLAAGWLRRR